MIKINTEGHNGILRKRKFLCLARENVPDETR